MKTGRLLVVPNALDLGLEATDLRTVLPDGVIREAAALKFWVAENARSARAFLKRAQAMVPLALALQDIAITEIPRPRKGGRAGEETTPASTWKELLAPALAGEDLGLISEAGLPGVADPGAGLVAAAHRQGIRVSVLSGPSAITLAVAASGLNGQSFAFVGYLPVDPAARTARLQALEAWSRRSQQAQVFIETPYRNAALLAALLGALADATWLSVSAGLTLPDGWTRTDTVAGWKQRRSELSDRVPAVFVLQAEPDATGPRRRAP